MLHIGPFLVMMHYINWCFIYLFTEKQGRIFDWRNCHHNHYHQHQPQYEDDNEQTEASIAQWWHLVEKPTASTESLAASEASSIASSSLVGWELWSPHTNLCMTCTSMYQMLLSTRQTERRRTQRNAMLHLSSQYSESSHGHTDVQCKVSVR